MSVRDAAALAAAALGVGVAVALGRRGTQPAPAPTPTPRGITVYAFPVTSVSEIAALPGFVGGVSIVVGWRVVEPSPGVYDWGVIDSLVAAAAASGRTCLLRVVAGHSTPSWVGGQWVTFVSDPGGPEPSQTIHMPLPWDTTYLSALRSFVAVLGQRYNGDRRIAVVAMTGGGWQGEMTLPPWTGWTAAGYTSAAMVATWRALIDAWRAAFPATPTSLGIDNPIHGDVTTLPAVLAYAANSYPALWVQQNGLRATPGLYYSTILAASSLTTVGWQTWGSATSAADLHSAFTVAITSGARFVECYLSDIGNPTYAAEFTYLIAGVPQP